MNENYQHIHTNGFVARENETETLNTRVSQNTFGLFTLMKFAVMQFIQGVLVETYVTDNKEQAERISRLVAKLSRETITSAVDMITLNLTRTEVTLLRKLLEFRIAHCEAQRDRGDEAFNPNTYISQKLLLLDIREWLMVSIVEEKTMDDVFNKRRVTDPQINYTMDEE